MPFSFATAVSGHTTVQVTVTSYFFPQLAFLKPFHSKMGALVCNCLKMGQNSKMMFGGERSRQAWSVHSISEGSHAPEVYLAQSAPPTNLKVRWGGHVYIMKHTRSDPQHYQESENRAWASGYMQTRCSSKVFRSQDSEKTSLHRFL